MYSIDIPPVSDLDNLASASSLQNAAANVLSDIKNVCKTSQRTGDSLVSGINLLIDQYLDVIKVFTSPFYFHSHKLVFATNAYSFQDKFHAECSNRDGYITLENIHSVLNLFKGQSVFEGVGTKVSLDSYLQQHSGGSQVSLKQVVLKFKKVLMRGIPREVPSKFGYVVTFLPQLEQFLNLPDVLECVENPLPNTDGMFKSVTDGFFYKYHPVVLKHGPQTLCFSMHVDDAEVCDPLKSHANKHSLRLFYWLLGNIHPEKRSTLKAINLMAIVKSKIAKEYGNEIFLRDFIDGIKKLGTEGVEFNIGGVMRRFYGVLLFGSADNPAAANLGGFKETHSALRPCRVCMVKGANLNDSFEENQLELRKVGEHEEQLKQVLLHSKKQVHTTPMVLDVCEDFVEEDEFCDIDGSEEKYLDHKNPSVNFGVNGSSVLAEAPGFDITKCLPQDLLHLLAEGVVELLCRRILKDLCIPKKVGKKTVKAPLSLKVLNQAIETQCDLGHYNVSRPSRIEARHLKGSKLKQSGAQMMVLLHVLPFVIHNVCPPEKMDLLIQLIRLVDLCMSFQLSKADIDRLRIMVAHYGTSFVKVYPNVKSLKLHGLIHLAMQALLFGPLRQQTCYRYEAMHSKFTSVATVVRSMKNIAFSCASRYTSERNSQIMRGKLSGNYLSEGDIVFSSTEVVVGELPEKNLLLVMYDLSESDSVFKSSKLRIRATLGKKAVFYYLIRTVMILCLEESTKYLSKNIAYTFCTMSM